jgi:predicted amidohydrolase YtcJ
MPVNWIVFSDDVGWCRENFRMDRTHFVEGNLDVVDMFLMSKCKHNIIANSSFSWWASYLNRNPDKKVIAPKNWFGPLMNKGVEDLYLNNWILV